MSTALDSQALQQNEDAIVWSPVSWASLPLFSSSLSGIPCWGQPVPLLPTSRSSPLLQAEDAIWVQSQGESHKVELPPDTLEHELPLRVVPVCRREPEDSHPSNYQLLVKSCQAGPKYLDHSGFQVWSKAGWGQSPQDSCWCWLLEFEAFWSEQRCLLLLWASA